MWGRAQDRFARMAGVIVIVGAALCLAPAFGAIASAAAPAWAATPEPLCAEAAYAVIENGTVGQPFPYSEAFGCLPGGHTFSNAIILWGDGTTSAGSLSPVDDQPFATVRVGGQHTYGQAGEFNVGVELTDDQTAQVYRRQGHAFVKIEAPTPAFPPPGRVEPSPPGPAPDLPGASVRASGRRLVVRQGVARLRVVALLRTSLPPESLRVELLWGDGTSSRGRLSRSNGELSVSARHRWHRAGHYAVAVQVTSAGGSKLATATTHVIVRAARPAAH